MAAQLKQELGIDAELVVGSSGEFTIWAGDRKIAEKVSGRFPEPHEVVGLLRATPS